MIKRIATIASVLAVALLGAGLAWAAIGGSPLASAPDAVAVESTTSVPGDTTTTTDDPGTTTTTEADDPGTTTTTEPGDDGGTTTTTEPEDDEPTTTTMPEDDEPVDIPATTYAAADAGSVTVAVEAGRLVFISADPAAGWSVDEVETGDNEVEVEFTDGDVKVKFEAEFEDGEIKVRVEVDEDEGDEGGTTTTTMPEDDGTTTTTMPGDDPVDIPPTTYAAADAGSVTVAVEAGSLVLVSVDPNPGWSVDETETHAHEVEVKFRNDGTEVEFKAEFEDGEIKVRVRVEEDEADDGTTTTTMPEDDEPVDIPATTYAAADAGSVTVAVEAGRLVFISADPAAGWSVDEVETGDNEVEVEFTDGDVKVKFEAEFEDGEIKVRVRVDD